MNSNKVGSHNVIRAFLFDIDGTLVDSSMIVERAWRQVAVEFDVDATGILGACHGRRDIEVFSDFSRAEDTKKVLARICELQADAVDGVVAVSGAGEVLSTLQDN